MGILIGVLWFVLVVVMLLLMAVILLQEGKGGGLAEAFGGAGGETFGVKSGGINRFTAILSGAFIVLAILINLTIQWDSDQEIIAPLNPAPVESTLSGDLPPAETDGDE